MMEELLHILEKNARLPVEDIAAMMGKTPAQVATMMDEAVAKGYIRGFEAMIDWEQAGINVVEAVIELHVSPRKSRGFDEIASVIASFHEVDSVLLMRGSYDLQVIIKGHGYGIMSVRHIVEKYNGSFSISTQDKLFQIDIIMPIPCDDTGRSAG